LRFVLIGLLCLPLIEIAVLIMVGSSIGVLSTIALVIFTGFMGSFLLRAQGFAAFSNLRRALESGQAPDAQIADAALIMVAGVMLIIPGFVSDLVGIALFIPFVRRWIVKSLAGNIQVVRPSARHRDTVIDLDADEYHRTDASNRDASETDTSPWRLPPDKQ
jgi:UPF0716 protein FxsA